MSEEKKPDLITYENLGVQLWLRELISDLATEYDLDVAQLGFEFNYMQGEQLRVYYAGKLYGEVVLKVLSRWGATYTEHTREQITDDMRRIFMRIAKEAKPPAEQRIVALLEQILEKLDEISTKLEV